jgi:hypothetical protein
MTGPGAKLERTNGSLRGQSFTVSIAQMLLWYRDFREADPFPSLSALGSDEYESALLGRLEESIAADRCLYCRIHRA